MTRKHFEAIATALRESRELAVTARELDLVDCAIRGVSRACNSFNNRFDRDRFEQACGLEG